MDAVKRGASVGFTLIHYELDKVQALRDISEMDALSLNYWVSKSGDKRRPDGPLCS